MSLPGFVPGLPRIGSRVNAGPRVVFRGGYTAYRAGGVQMDGAYSRDPGNTGDLNVLRAGQLVGKRTSDSYYAPSFFGATTGAYTSGGLSLSLAAAVVTEIVRRVGASGTLRIVGPATANGAPATENVTYSAASGTTLTISSLSNNYVSGSLILPNDGSDTPLFPIVDPYGIQVTDIDNTTNIKVPIAEVPIAGEIYTSQLLLGGSGYPTDTGIQAWLKAELSKSGFGYFTFDDNF